MTRIYQNTVLTLNEPLLLDEAATHHLARVLRAEVGEAITVFNGQGGEYHGVIAAISKKAVTVALSAFDPRECESPVEIVLGQGIARGEKMDFIIQKAVELGVSKIVPLQTERGNVHLSAERMEKRHQHWQSVLISACEQCGRNRLPTLLPAMNLPSFLAEKQAELQFVLSPHTQAQLSFTGLKPRSVAILIGPEGGLSANEMALAERHHFSALALGPRVLRTETASLVALSVLQTGFGDLLGKN